MSINNNDNSEEIQRLVEDLRELHLKSERVIRRIDELSRQKKAPKPSSTRAKADGESTKSGEFKYGDKVFITNAIRHIPLTRRATVADRAGTVSRPITSNRIYLTTAKGDETWRLGKNLKRLTLAEYEELANPQGPK